MVARTSNYCYAAETECLLECGMRVPVFARNNAEANYNHIYAFNTFYVIY